MFTISVPLVWLRLSTHAVRRDFQALESRGWVTIDSDTAVAYPTQALINRLLGLT